MRPVFDPRLPSDGKYYLLYVYIYYIYFFKLLVGQFLRQPHGRGLTDNYYLKTIDAAPRYICLFPGEHPHLASLLEVSL